MALISVEEPNNKLVLLACKLTVALDMAIVRAIVVVQPPLSITVKVIVCMPAVFHDTVWGPSPVRVPAKPKLHWYETILPVPV